MNSDRVFVEKWWDVSRDVCGLFLLEQTGTKE